MSSAMISVRPSRENAIVELKIPLVFGNVASSLPVSASHSFADVHLDVTSVAPPGASSACVQMDIRETVGRGNGQRTGDIAEDQRYLQFNDRIFAGWPH